MRQQEAYMQQLQQHTIVAVVEKEACERWHVCSSPGACSGSRQGGHQRPGIFLLECLFGLTTMPRADNGEPPTLLDAYCDDPACSICCQDFVEADVLRVLQCRHVFHRHCIDRWVCMHGTATACPLCKQPIMVSPASCQAEASHLASNQINEIPGVNDSG
eukprot:CAMPEP_0183362128 /NCGR_PEP_ID=MMETSP0164_2-20130417/66848_1 /TAXON_ID=221442 /ORGANISM="Coccolithus pelagicus ssp braarudi, Strain PLY182g" /LENGTH=159 /DNA_ID=CAMNT_0025536907 /DNA_START=150 /DNA_END=625 /DNA_ORIENTATION=+